MAKKIKTAKIISCLPLMHVYGRAFGQGSRLYVSCTRCGKTKRA